MAPSQRFSTVSDQPNTLVTLEATRAGRDVGEVGIGRDDRIRLDGELMTVRSAVETPDGFECVVKTAAGDLREVFIHRSQLAEIRVAAHDGGGDGARALTAVWAKWMQWAIPRIRSAVLATRPLRPYFHQDDAVTIMLKQARLRFLLADEPGTGKTLMTGMYLAEGRRRGLIPGKTIIVVPAHLVEKWIRELKRFFGIDAHRITQEIGRDPLDLRSDVDVWVVSVDLYTYNSDVRRKIVGSRASWSLAVFDEAHRLTPTSQYLGAARQLAELTHHLLLLTATPHRGKEHYFRALVNLTDPRLYPWSNDVKDYGGLPLRPGPDHFLRRMKEELKDLEGNPLFPRRFAETVGVHLTPAEADAYDAVMDYVDEWYDDSSILARSIYGKRAASSVQAALETLRRRAAALGPTQAGKVDNVAPAGFERPDFAGADVDSDEAWEKAERAVLEARSRDRKAELEAAKGVISQLETALRSKDEPAKWQAAAKLLAHHGIHPGPGGNQLLVFTEFTDTAQWLAGMFRQNGYDTEVLHGDVDPRDRESLQERFLSGQYQVLVSTDAGGEGIDLQSAHVMIDWDIPWSLVRLEQRAGRLHRIGQKDDVYVYHLVANETREGRVQQVMLGNLTTAGKALNGRIYDLLDATVDRTDFDFTAAMAAAQRGGASAEQVVATIPDADTLIARAREIVAEEDRLKTPVNENEAKERYAADRLQAINPVIVAAFVENLARTAGWSLTNGPAAGIKVLASPALPRSVSLDRECLIAADATSVTKARSEGFLRASEVVVLGPTEPPFQALVDYASRTCDQDLLRGGTVTDLASLTDYSLFVYAAEFEHHDGVRRTRRTVPFLLRFSGAGSFEVAWESVMNLVPVGEPASPPEPAARFEADAAARLAVERETDRLVAEQRAITAKGRSDLDDIERRYKRGVRDLPSEQRRAALEEFARSKADRLAQLDLVEAVASTAPRLVGWLRVHGGARIEDLGFDPDAEKVAIAKVVAELEALGWAVDDRQTARLGYDLFARRPGTTEQRLVEVKGFTGALDGVVLEQHEWAQAQQRGADYWLYVVVDCGTAPKGVVRVQDPAGTLSSGPKLIERYRIPLSQLRRLMENQ